MSLAGFIAAQRACHGIPYATSCRALGVSQAWFYKWRDGDVSIRRARRQALAAQIGYVFTRHRRRYGSPRITADLREQGWRVSKNTVAAIMRERGLVARRKRRRWWLTQRDRNARKAPDLLRREFGPPQRPNVHWCGDLTDIVPPITVGGSVVSAADKLGRVARAHRPNLGQESRASQSSSCFTCRNANRHGASD